MGEKRQGFWSRLLPPDGGGEDPSPEVVAGWLAEGDGARAVRARDAADEDEDEDEDEDDDPPGVIIVELPPGSPLRAAGLRVSDLVVGVNGTPTPTEGALAGALGFLPPGGTAMRTVIRAGRELGVPISSPD